LRSNAKAWSILRRRIIAKLIASTIENCLSEVPEDDFNSSQFVLRFRTHHLDVSTPNLSEKVSAGRIADFVEQEGVRFSSNKV